MNKTKKELLVEIDELKKEMCAKDICEVKFERKTKAELYEEIVMLQEEIRMMEKYKEFEKSAKEMACMITAYEHAGFTREEVMSILAAAVGAMR